MLWAICSAICPHTVVYCCILLYIRAILLYTAATTAATSCSCCCSSCVLILVLYIRCDLPDGVRRMLWRAAYALALRRITRVTCGVCSGQYALLCVLIRLYTAVYCYIPGAIYLMACLPRKRDGSLVDDVKVVCNGWLRTFFFLKLQIISVK
jgi:hypothetical protein